MTSGNPRIDLRGNDYSKIFPNCSQEKINEITSSFKDADLRGSSFKGLSLVNVDFSGAWIQGASFHKAIFENVSFIDVKGGISGFGVLFLWGLCFTLSFLSGLICAYSVDFLYTLIAIPISSDDVYGCKELFGEGSKCLSECLAKASENVNSNPITDHLNQVLGLVICSLFIASIVIIWYVGVGFLFFIFVVSSVGITFALMPIAPDTLTATAASGIASFLGGLSGIFARSHASFLNEELDEQEISTARNPQNTRISYRIRCALSWLCTILGIFFGALFGHSSFITSVLFSLGLVIFGHRISINMRDSDFTLSERHSILYQIFELSFLRFGTNFSEATFNDVNFEGARMKGVDFSYASREGKGIKNLNERIGAKIIENAAILIPSKGRGRAPSYNFNAKQIIFNQSQVGNIHQENQHS